MSTANRVGTHAGVNGRDKALRHPGHQRNERTETGPPPPKGAPGGPIVTRTFWCSCGRWTVTFGSNQGNRKNRALRGFRLHVIAEQAKGGMR